MPENENINSEEITRLGAKELLNTSSDAENLANLYPDIYAYVESHVASGANTRPEQGWTEKEYEFEEDYGGCVRSAVLSGSCGEFKKVRVDSEIISDEITTNLLSVSESARVNTLNVDGDLTVSGALKPENITVRGDLEVQGNSVLNTVEVSGSLAVEAPATFNEAAIFSSSVIFTETPDCKQDLYVRGDLYVEGSASYIHTKDLYVKDKCITVASGSPDPQSADGAGFEIDGADVSFIYSSDKDAMTLNTDLAVDGEISASSITVNEFSADSITVDNVSVSGAISASAFYGDGSNLTGITASIVSVTTYTASYHIPISEVNDFYRVTHNLDTENVIVSIYMNADIKDGQGTVQPVQILPEQLSVPDANYIDIVFGDKNSGNDIDGYVVVAKAGHVIEESDISQILDENDVHYGTTGSWAADSFTAISCSGERVEATEVLVTPIVGLRNEESYYSDQDISTRIELHPHDIEAYIETSSLVPAARLEESGDLLLSGDLVVNNTFLTSDINKKTDVRTLEEPQIQKLRGVRFRWKGTNEESIGVIAQEIQSIYPELTKEVKDLDSTNKLTVNYEGLVGVLIEAVKSLQSRVEYLESYIQNENR